MASDVSAFPAGSNPWRAAFSFWRAKVSLRQSLSTAGTWNLILAAATIQITLATGLRAAYHLRLLDGALYSVSWHMIAA